MRRRLYFLLPDIESARKVEEDLLLARIEEGHMHYLARRGMDLGDLPEASVSQKTDFVHGLKVGLITGGSMGFIIGLVALFQFGATLVSGFTIFLGLFVLGAAFGVFASALVASSTPNTMLKPFQKALDEGHILLMVDVPKERVHEISEIIRKTHPEAEDHGVEPTIPAFP
jgi:hypothetical protein